MRSPLLVAYGLGRDSTAMLIEMHKRRLHPSAILWANTGSEKTGTYAYLPIIQAWLVGVGFPPVTVVQYQPRHAVYRSLEGNMVLNGNCKKFAEPPPGPFPLRQALLDAGHAVPELVLEARPGKTIYREDRRVPLAMAEETAIHRQLVEDL